MNIFDKAPVINKDAFVAPSASIIGDVQVGRMSSIWYGCVLRGKHNIGLFEDVHHVSFFISGSVLILMAPPLLKLLFLISKVPEFGLYTLYK